MAVSLQTYLNNQLKAKGMTVAQAKKNAGKYKSISAAKKAGSLYYTNKDGKVMAAVYAEDLKKAPVRPKKKPSDPRAKRPKQPKGAPPLRERDPVKTETLLPGSDKTLNKALNQPSGRGDGRKETLKRQTDPKSPSRLKGQKAMDKITRSQWANMSKSERRALGLPATRVAAMASKLRDAKFKDGKSF